MKQEVFHPKGVFEKMVLSVVPVGAVADHIMPVMGQMPSDLMHATRMGMYF